MKVENNKLKIPKLYIIVGIISSISMLCLLFAFFTANYIYSPIVTFMLLLVSIKFFIVNILAYKEYKDLKKNKT